MPRRPTHMRKNRDYWDREADAYQRSHGRTLSRTAMAWGVWRIPESELGALGDVAGKDVLELGCGAAQWSVALAGLGARPVGLDLSGRQLHHARRKMRRAGVSFPLVQAGAEYLPFRDERFDLVFCDHGAMTFTPPARSVPEAARVLRDGGLLVFSIGTPLLFLCWNPDTQEVEPSLHADWFSDMRSEEDETLVQFQVPYGEWIRLFRENGLVVEDLLHLRPPAGARTSYRDFVPYRWARRWPAEDLWRVRKRTS